MVYDKPGMTGITPLQLGGGVAISLWCYIVWFYVSQPISLKNGSTIVYNASFVGNDDVDKFSDS